MVEMKLALRKPDVRIDVLFCLLCTPVAHYRRVGMSLAGEGDSVPLQDGAGLDGQGHNRRI